jgi:hypothetical protein
MADQRAQPSGAGRACASCRRGAPAPINACGRRGGTGRRMGLKIPWGETPVQVRLLPSAPSTGVTGDVMAMRLPAAAVIWMLAAPPAVAAPTASSCWSILDAVKTYGEIAWVLQCTISQRDARPMAALQRCRDWLVACRRNPFSGGKPGLVSFSRARSDQLDCFVMRELLPRAFTPSSWQRCRRPR